TAPGPTARRAHGAQDRSTNPGRWKYTRPFCSPQAAIFSVSRPRCRSCTRTDRISWPHVRDFTIAETGDETSPPPRQRVGTLDEEPRALAELRRKSCNDAVFDGTPCELGAIDRRLGGAERLNAQRIADDERQRRE